MFPNHEKRRFRCVTLEPFACSWSARIALISVFSQSTSSERCFLLVNLLYPTTLSSRKTRSKKSRYQENHKAERSPQRTTLWRYRGFTDGHERSEESRATSTPSPRIESAPAQHIGVISSRKREKSKKPRRSAMTTHHPNERAAGFRLQKNAFFGRLRRFSKPTFDMI